jgi:hypothetical protein
MHQYKHSILQHKLHIIWLYKFDIYSKYGIIIDGFGIVDSVHLLNNKTLSVLGTASFFFGMENGAEGPPWCAP